jgi:hypothetical protein
MVTLMQFGVLTRVVNGGNCFDVPGAPSETPGFVGSKRGSYSNVFLILWEVL